MIFKVQFFTATFSLIKLFYKIIHQKVILLFSTFYLFFIQLGNFEVGLRIILYLFSYIQK